MALLLQCLRDVRILSGDHDLLPPLNPEDAFLAEGLPRLRTQAVKNLRPFADGGGVLLSTTLSSQPTLPSQENFVEDDAQASLRR